jgi:hypothetical protein
MRSIFKHLLRRITSFLRRWRLLISAVASGLVLAVTLVGCASGPPPGGGMPSSASTKQALHFVVAGLKTGDEKLFLKSVNKGTRSAELGWSRCEPAIAQSARISSGSSDSTLIGIVVEVPHNVQAGCSIVLAWSYGDGWTMTTFRGSGGRPGCKPGVPSGDCGPPSSTPSPSVTP